MYSVRWFSISRLNTVCRIFFEILLLTDWSIKFCISFGFNVKWMWVILICLLGNFVGYKYCTSRQSRWPILFTQLYGLYPKWDNLRPLIIIIYNCLVISSRTLTAAPSRKDSAIPIIPYKGVLSSWDVIAKNSSFNSSAFLRLSKASS